LELLSINIQKVNAHGRKLTNSVRRELVSVGFKLVENLENAQNQTKEQNGLEEKSVQHPINHVFGKL
jgi:hypothetical protein